MKKNPNNLESPPRWATRLLHWYCKPELVEDLEGDLNEYFDRNLKARGATKAKLIYIVDVIKFFRIYTLRKPRFINYLINWIMLSSYIKTSGRSISRNPLFSTINIVGLAISMSVGLLLIGVLVDMYSYDQFHENHKRIYRVISRYQFLENKDNDFMATSSLRAAKEIKETFTGLEEVAVFRRGFEGDITFGEKTIPLRGMWASETIFNVFTFPLVQGNTATALKLPYSVVLTESTALKLVGEVDAIGKTVTLNNDKSYTITGIMKDVPKFSHMNFEVLASMSTREISEKDNASEMAWDNMWNAWTYILLPEQADLVDFQNYLNKLSERVDPTVKNTHIELALQPMDDIMIGANLGNQIGTTLGTTLILVFSALAFVVIISAIFNYTNLSIARSLRRSKEVGIRKVIGAERSHVIGQFVVEAILISVLSLAAALLIFVLLRPHFINLEADLQALLVLELTPLLVIYFIAFAVFVGIIAGIFPALFFAKVNAIKVLKNVTSAHLFQKITMRKVLIVFQYGISIMLITGTLIIYQQYKYYIAFDLGFSTENILNIRLQGNKAELLKKELYELPEVKQISQSVLITSVGNYWGANIRSMHTPEDSAFVYANLVDENYIPLHKHQLLAGSNFNAKADDAIESEVIVNQQILKRFNLAEQIPAKAIGEVLKVNGKELKIIGVMKDFQYGHASNANANEVMLRYSSKEVEFLNVKIESSDLLETYAKIQTIWRKMDNVHPFDAKFYDDAIQDAFSGIRASVKLAGAVAFLAICIASLGLLGMVVFTTETRLKEISIRKVLGASEGKLLFLLGKGFFVLLAISVAIALPATYLFFDKVMLPQIGNALSLSIWEGIIGVVAVMIIALVMIGYQTLKVARTNPAEVLKNE